LDKEHADTLSTSRWIGFGGDEIQISVDTVGDEYFLTAEKPAVGIAHRRRLNGCDVRAGSRLGDTERADLAAGSHVTQMGVLLLPGAETYEVRLGDFVVRAQGHAHAACMRLANLFAHDDCHAAIG